MAQIRQTVLMMLLIVMSGFAAGGDIPKFFPDDPIQAMPTPVSVTKLNGQKVNDALDFFSQYRRREPRSATPAGAVNTLGEVPDSEWFTNRHGRQRMSREELQQGPTSEEAPLPPFKVVRGKQAGIMHGFVMDDTKGRRYFVKGDPVSYPELATAAEAIVSKFLYAIGYNTPKNDVVDLKLSDLRLSSKAKITAPDGRLRRMTWNDIEHFAQKTPQSPDGSFRVVASLAVEGEGIGPFRYEGMRSDDPNDITPHENRRDLRGLYVFSAWLNHTDSKATNTLDTIVEENGNRFIRHYLIDFGSALGSDGDSTKDARLGHEFMLPTPTKALKQMLKLGLVAEQWEKVRYPKLPGIGNFSSADFHPDDWKPNYPNPAFLSRLPDDDFWAAKHVMAFTDDDIRTIVETAKFTDARSTEYMIATLAERRNKIGRTFFSKIFPLDHFRVENRNLLFDDLAVQHGFHPSRQYDVRWFRFSNTDRKHEPIAGAESSQLPLEALQAPSGAYISAAISAIRSPLKPVTVYFRKEGHGFKVVGIDRTW